MRKYLLHILIILFVFLLAPTAQVVSYAGWIEDAIEDAKEEVRKRPGLNGERGNLYKHFLRFVDAKKPLAFEMELKF